MAHMCVRHCRKFFFFFLRNRVPLPRGGCEFWERQETGEETRTPFGSFLFSRMNQSIERKRMRIANPEDKNIINWAVIGDREREPLQNILRREQEHSSYQRNVDKLQPHKPPYGKRTFQTNIKTRDISTTVVASSNYELSKNDVVFCQAIVSISIENNYPRQRMCSVWISNHPML